MILPKVEQPPVILRSLRFQNFKGLRDFTVRLHSLNVLVGPNNAGKSTILDGLRTIFTAIKFGRRRNPTLLSVHGQAIWGYEIPTSLIPISLANIHSDYRDVETTVTLALETGSRIRLAFYDNSRCVMTLDEEGAPTRTTTQFRKNFPVEIVCFPTLGPLEDEERLLDEDDDTAVAKLATCTSNVSQHFV